MLRALNTLMLSRNRFDGAGPPLKGLPALAKQIVDEWALHPPPGLILRVLGSRAAAEISPMAVDGLIDGITRHDGRGCLNTSTIVTLAQPQVAAELAGENANLTSGRGSRQRHEAEREGSRSASPSPAAPDVCARALGHRLWTTAAA